MTYVPRSGWIERTDEPTDERTRVSVRFHGRSDCERINNPVLSFRSTSPTTRLAAPAAPVRDLPAPAPLIPRWGRGRLLFRQRLFLMRTYRRGRSSDRWRISVHHDPECHPWVGRRRPLAMPGAFVLPLLGDESHPVG
jgi:hypothetical protein